MTTKNEKRLNVAIVVTFFAGLTWLASTHETVNNVRTYDRMPVETREYVYELMQPTNIDTTTNTGRSMLVEFWKDNLLQVTEWELDNDVCW